MLWICVLYGQDLSAADSAENKILVVNGDDSVPFLEYRIVVHSTHLDAQIAAHGAEIHMKADNAPCYRPQLL